MSEKCRWSSCSIRERNSKNNKCWWSRRKLGDVTCLNVLERLEIFSDEEFNELEIRWHKSCYSTFTSEKRSIVHQKEHRPIIVLIQAPGKHDNWNLHWEVFAAIAPWLTIYDHTNYARWASIYHDTNSWMRMLFWREQEDASTRFLQIRPLSGWTEFAKCRMVS